MKKLLDIYRRWRDRDLDRRISPATTAKIAAALAGFKRYGIEVEFKRAGGKIEVAVVIPDDTHDDTVNRLIVDYFVAIDSMHREMGGSGFKLETLP